MSEPVDQIEKARPRRFRPYTEYQDSGVEWLGDIPADWEVRRLKYLASANDETLPEGTDPDWQMTYVDISSVDVIDGITATETLMFEKAPSRARRIVRDGDVIVSTVRTYLRAIASIQNPVPNLIVSTGFAVIRPKQLDSSFAAYALRAPNFVERVVANSVGVSYPAINASDLVCFPIGYPPMDQQQAIVRFLNRETAKIDELVARKERLIELLQEKRTAIISRAATRGLDPNVRVKESGFEWLGKVPAHWEIIPLKRLWIRSDYGLSDSLSGHGRVRVLTMAHIQDGEIVVPEEGCLDEVPPELLLEHHDLLYNRTNSRDLVGKVGLFRGSISDEVSFASYLVRLSAAPGVDPEFMNYLLNSRGVQSKARSLSLLSVNQANLNPTRFGEIVGVLPPLHEQVQIVRELNRECQVIERLTSQISRAAHRLKEFRTALISAAVTGKIDVREEVS